VLLLLLALVLPLPWLLVLVLVLLVPPLLLLNLKVLVVAGLVVVTRDVVGLLLFEPSLRLAVVVVCWEKKMLYLIKTC